MFYDEKMVDKYLDVLLDELKNMNLKHKLKTIYIGGGTPSSLNFVQLERLLVNLNKYLEIAPYPLTLSQVKSCTFFVLYFQS